ncbi:MAG TPA: hypothetical protein VFN09_11475 [Rhodanobacteraceae bacterium]|nr:hypothetical protein [Rhodanobacteraceae bacterium]
MKTRDLLLLTLLSPLLLAFGALGLWLMLAIWVGFGIWVLRLLWQFFDTPL